MKLAVLAPVLILLTACSRPAAPVVTEPEWFRPKPQMLTNVRATEQGLALGTEKMQGTMWAAGFDRIGFILYEPADVGTPVDQLLVTYSVQKAPDTLFWLQVRGSPDRETWTEWSEVDASGSVVRLRAPSRYVQFWIHLAANADTPVVADVAVKPAGVTPGRLVETCQPQQRLWQYVNLFGADDVVHKARRDQVVREAALTPTEVKALGESISRAYMAVARDLPTWIGMQPGPDQAMDAAGAEAAIRTMEQETQTLLGERYPRFRALVDRLEPCK